jgi:hypothetical protein
VPIVTNTYLRYCPECGEEYQPHVTHCLDCGSPLKEKLEGEVVVLEAPLEETAPDLPPGEYARVAHGLSAGTAEPLVRLFVAAGIPVKVESVGYGLTLSARLEDHPAVIAILEREGVLPAQPDGSAPAIAQEGGPCPACGASLAPGIVECAECGLTLGGSGCENCGAELGPTDESCPACGYPVG